MIETGLDFVIRRDTSASYSTRRNHDRELDDELEATVSVSRISGIRIVGCHLAGVIVVGDHFILTAPQIHKLKTGHGDALTVGGLFGTDFLVDIQTTGSCSAKVFPDVVGRRPCPLRVGHPKVRQRCAFVGGNLTGESKILLAVDLLLADALGRVELHLAAQIGRKLEAVGHYVHHDQLLASLLAGISFRDAGKDTGQVTILGVLIVVGFSFILQVLPLFIARRIGSRPRDLLSVELASGIITTGRATATLRIVGG